MKCADCENALEPTPYEDVSILCCPKCNGRFLDEEQLQNIEKCREVRIDRKKRYSKRRYEKSRLCPQCNTTMEKTQHGIYTPVNINKCSQCSGIWLDEGELEDIQNNNEMHVDNLNKNK